ncbi:hypothetical protein F9B85_09735 [Heliorestis acidaminivorans]|uniref:Glycosyl hydrolase family 13 catalytic domain-containing protein n=1 Tax=Heliorestis acidaminivorans TaxID=553427 RepID=A0A6I0ERC4_9FIRM|nr:alpha-amylase family glycosyl hydrolase [Heliorestis acidaminivorans]KAB2952086.1 hypothetical protein F9B85_09735 [Heliorestis acidaminivorans]
MTSVPEWFRSAIIYQIYPRVHGFQEGRFGTLVDIEKDLERIQKLGANTIWLMPIQPLGEVNRKGISGSPYAIRDYKSISADVIACDRKEELSPDDLEALGKEQFRSLVKSAHQRGMRVLMDFVGNHCAPDNVLLDPANPPQRGGYHPEWFIWDQEDKLPLAPEPDWWDTVDINYGIAVPGKPNYHRLYHQDEQVQKELWAYMTSVLTYWVKEFDIDGYRCDFAHWVPLEFWREAIAEVKGIKKETIFFAEAYDRLKELLESGFDATYAFEIYNQLKSLHHDVKYDDPYFEVPYIKDKINWERNRFGPRYCMVRYTENHDEIRSIVMYGSEERSKPPFLLALTLPGVPLLYAGQEAGAVIRPPLFEGNFGEEKFQNIDFHGRKDLTKWYEKVLTLRQEKSYLKGPELTFVIPSNRKMVIYLRRWGNEMALMIINFAFDSISEDVEFDLPAEILQSCWDSGGQLVDLLEGQQVIKIGSRTVAQRVKLTLSSLQSLLLEMRNN